MSNYLFAILLILISIFILFINRPIETFQNGDFEIKCKYCCNMLANSDPDVCAKKCIINGVKCHCCN
jgi:hypothetical protein